MTTTAEASGIAPRPPLRLRPVDALGLPLAAAAAALLAAHGWSAAAIAPVSVAALAAPALARIDLAERRLPNALTVPLLAVGAAASAARLLAGDPAPLVALGCGALMLLMAITGGMGMGDVKLHLGLALAAATLGWAVPLAALAASVVVGGIAGAAALAAGRRTVAFGPWLLVGHGTAIIAAGASGG